MCDICCARQLVPGMSLEAVSGSVPRDATNIREASRDTGSRPGGDPGRLPRAARLGRCTGDSRGAGQHPGDPMDCASAGGLQRGILVTGN
jgi:hypothetical protein